MKNVSSKKQRGYFLILAIILVLTIGLMANLIAYLFANRAQLSVAQQNGLNTLYIAESGLEITSRLLNSPFLTGANRRISCASVTGHELLTNSAMGAGVFTVSTTNNSPIYAINYLPNAIDASMTTIPLTSSAGFAPSGGITIDKEYMSYRGISGNSLVGITRGLGGTIAASHFAQAPVSQYLCALDILSGIPNLSSKRYQRELKWNVQLQNGWIVGNASGPSTILLQWNRPNANSWRNTTTGLGSSTNFNAVSMLSNADGWAVGDEVSNFLSLIHWNGSSWTSSIVSGCADQDLFDVSMISSHDGFAVGARYGANNCSGENRYNILRWNGSVWTKLAPAIIPNDGSSVQNLNGVSVIDTNNDGIANLGFAVGNSGTILRFNGANWRQAQSPTPQNLFSIQFVSASEAWAVGAAGVILRWTGGNWSSVSSPTNVQLNNISMFDSNGDGIADFGMIAGNSGVILTYNGSSWSISTVGSNNYFGVYVINSSDAWITGSGGMIRHWDGQTWAVENIGTAAQLNHIAFVKTGTVTTTAWQQVFR